MGQRRYLVLLDGTTNGRLERAVLSVAAAQQQLDDENVEPGAVELAVAAVDADALGVRPETVSRYLKAHEAMREFERETDLWPHSSDWTVACEDWPSASTVYNRLVACGLL